MPGIFGRAAFQRKGHNDSHFTKGARFGISTFVADSHLPDGLFSDGETLAQSPSTGEMPARGSGSEGGREEWAHKISTQEPCLAGDPGPGDIPAHQKDAGYLPAPSSHFFYFGENLFHEIQSPPLRQPCPHWGRRKPAMPRYYR